ncbi:MAG: Pr6Pr family membrane protein [Microbacterium arborescens]
METPTRTNTWSTLRLLMSAAIVAAVVTQLTASLTRTAETGGDVATVFANFFSFFTILSNVIAAVVLAWAALAALRDPAKARASLGLSAALACATTYMAITGIVYNALLRGITLPQGSEPVPWSNEVLHLVAPLFLLLDLVIGSARRGLLWRVVGAIIAFPLLWVTYTLIRGPLVTNPTTGDPYWYPYPFLNPNNPGGWGMVIAYVIGIALAFVVIGFFAVWVTRRRARRDGD